MVKKQKAASAIARTGGSFIGGITNNPGIVIIALVLGGLFLFRDKIAEGFAGLKFPEFPAFPEINFPEFPAFPEINFPEFPELPDFTSFFTGFQEQLTNIFNNQQSILAGQTVDVPGGTVVIPPDTIVNPDGTVSSTTPPISMGQPTTEIDVEGNVLPLGTFAQERASAFDFLFDLGVPLNQITKEIGNIEFGDITGLNKLVERFQEFFGQPEPPPLSQGLDNQGIGFDVPFNDPLGLGGGGSFIGGTTTFGDQTNIIDTLSEVLNIFPGLTASQASNALFSNPGLTGNEFAQITPINPSISSAGFDPEQILNQASGGFSGLTAEQIANILTGGNIQNF